MEYATTRSLERVAAAMGALESAPIQFEPAQDVSQGGVLLALPALLATGLLRFTQQFYALPKGFYGIDSIFLLLALMALARIPSIEQLRYAAPGEWGNLLGLDRVPEVRTLRAKLELLCREAGRAVRWHTALAREWIAGVVSSELVFYADGHVRVYHGDLTALPRHYVARERLCMRATTDYWIHAMDGQPFFYINKEVDPGLIATLRHDLVPFLENQVPLSVELQKRMEDNPRQHRFTLVFDREAYSPELFAEMQAKRIAVVTYHKYPGEDWPAEEFREQTVELGGGAVVRMKLGERQRQLVQFAAQSLQGELSESEVTRYQQKKAQLQEEIEHLGQQLDEIKLQRKQTAHHVTVGELPEAERFSRLLPERKHFLDTIKLISYRAETSMASLLRESMSRGDDTRALLRQIYSTEADLLPDADHKTLTVRLHHLTQAVHDQALLRLCDELNATETIFPGTDLRLIYKLGSC